MSLVSLARHDADPAPRIARALARGEEGRGLSRRTRFF